MRNTRVLVADAGSSDGTVEIVQGFADRLQVEVIPGGLPSVGRNAGARQAQTRYVLFLDADMELADPTLVRRAVELANRKRLHCVTTNVACRAGGFADHLLYFCNNLVQRGSRWFGQPFSTGMFMLFERQRFHELGGFDEGALYAEDYLLSKKVGFRRFRVVGGKVLTTNRRFQKMGHLKIARMFVVTALNSRNHGYFLRDHKYWQ